MKLLLLLLAALTARTAIATNYFFSTALGDDSRSSLQAQNSASPWKTLDKLNSIFGGLQPGDSLLLRRGDTFYGSIIVTKSGTTALPIVVAAYGTGNKPVITGFATLSNWSASGGNIWGSTSSLLGAKLNMVVVNDVAYAMGRYPNSDAAVRGYLTYESSVGNTQIIDNELTAATNWTGAEVVIRKVHGVIDRNLITAHSGNTLSYITGSAYTPSANFGYFIQNDIRTLDKFGEWYYDPFTKKLNVYFAGNSPSAYDVKASAVGTLINVNSQSNVVFYNLAVTGANVDGFRINGAQNVYIKNCDVGFSGENGIRASYTNYLRVEDCSVAYSNNNGIDLAYNNDHAVIRNNRVENTFVFAGMGTSGDGNGTGINSRGKVNTLEYNQIINTGYNGIAFTEDDAVIKNNFINNFCFVKDDGGGIYTYVGGNAVAPQGRKIIGNVILNGSGAGPGTNDTTFQAANGIFLDDNTSGVEIKDNTVANNAHFGIFFHNAHDIVLKNNTLFNNKEQLMMRSSEQVAGSVANNDISNNIFYSKFPAQMVSHLISARNDIDNFARFDSNYYCRPLDDRLTIQNDLLYNYGNSTKSDIYDLEGWKAKYQKDAASKKSPVQASAYAINNLNASNKFTNGAFNNDIGYVNCWTPLGNCSTSWNSGGKLDGGAMQIAFSAPTTSYDVATTSLSVGSISNNKNYILRFSLLGSLNGKSLAVYLRDNNLYTKLTPIKYVKISTSRTENEVLFSLPVSAGNAGLLFEVNDQFNTIWLDNVQLLEADVTLANPDNYIRFETNPDKTAKTISLDAIYLDAKNNSYSNAVTLQPFSSLVLMKSSVLLSQTIVFGPLSNKTYGDPAFTLSATASSGLPVSFRVVSGPATVSGNTLTLTGAGTITVEASQAGNGIYSSAPAVSQSFTVAAAAACSATGTILYEKWNNLPGWSIATIPLQTTPNSTAQLSSLESQDAGQLYGVRIRGYICPPQSGSYTFWISGDDVLELWLSTDDNPANKVKVCTTNYTMFREWNKYPSQKSAPITLQSGIRYYIEVLHKEGGGGGHSSVAWTLPNGTFQGPIPGNQLSPYVPQYNTNTLSRSGSVTNAMEETAISAFGNQVAPTLFAYPNPFKTIATVQFSISKPGRVTLEIFDVQGQLVRSLFRGDVEANALKNKTFSTEGLKAGTYILRMTTKDEMINKKIILAD